MISGTGEVGGAPETPDAKTLNEMIADVFTGLLGGEVDAPGVSEHLGVPLPMAGAVSVRGEWSAEVVFACSAPFARRVAGELLESEPDDLADEDVRDVLGEFANVIGGNVKSIMPGPSTLSLPYTSLDGDIDHRDAVESLRLELGVAERTDLRKHLDHFGGTRRQYRDTGVRVMKILVADDSRVMRQIVVRALRQAGYGDHTVVEATDGRDALAKVQEEQPDLVLCDWNMPEMSGLDLLTAMRIAGDGRPFGFVTSEGSDHMRSLAAQEGALFLITKPFSSDTFRDVLEPVLG